MGLAGLPRPELLYGGGLGIAFGLGLAVHVCRPRGGCSATTRHDVAVGIAGGTRREINTNDEGRRGFDALGGRCIPVVTIEGMVVRGCHVEVTDTPLARRAQRNVSGSANLAFRRRSQHRIGHLGCV